MKIIKMPVARLFTEALNNFIEDLLTKLTANVADFPNPPPALAASQTILNTKLEQLATLEGQITAKRIEIEDAAAIVRANANAMGDWAEGVTQDRAKLSRVFPLRETPAESGPTPRVTNLRLSIGDSAGHVDGAWDSLYKSGVKSYEVETVLNPLNNDPSTGPWVRQPTVTKSTCTLSGFTSGARIWVRVRGIGPNGAGDWSDPATIIVP